MTIKMRNLKSHVLTATVIGLVVIVAGSLYFYPKEQPVVQREKDPYIGWGLEAFDKIQTTYWKKASEEDLSNLFDFAVEKVSGKPANLQSKTRAGIKDFLTAELSGKEELDKKKFVTNVVAVALYNLLPIGRNGLYTSKDETALRNEVKNVDPGKDLYSVLGLAKGASPEEIEQSYQTLVKKLTAENTPEAKQKIEELSYAKKVLTTPDSKAVYDETKIEPTVFGKTLSPEVYYVYLSKFSPTTYDEFVKILNATDGKTNLKALVIDIRGNIGGAVDILPYFLGLFIGQGQYAYDFFHQENYDPNKTKFPKLPSLLKFKNIALLTDNGTQSSAEIMTTTFKRFNVGVVVGKTTKGWGTIENTFPLETIIDPVERYSLFLVHSLTIRDDDGQPIEGRGVDPNVDITKPNWKKELADYVNYQPLLDAIKNAISKPPQK